MPNTTINATEANWLSQQICHAYESTNPPLGKLTGTISIYEKVGFFMQHRIEATNYLLEYYHLLAESAWKFYLRKNGVESGRADALAKRYGQALSPNSLRKLIFDRPRQVDNQVSFQEDFIHACYVFLLKDRLAVLPQFTKLQEPSNSPMIRTINPYAALLNLANDDTVDIFQSLPGFSLQPLMPNNEADPRKEDLVFGGDHAALNRDNLEPSNLTITSKVQAVIQWQDGNWVIENQSELQTTMVQVTRPMVLKHGDIIVMGNRKFRVLLE